MKPSHKILDRNLLKGGNKFDITLLWVIIVMVSFGLIMVFSATIAGRESIEGKPYYFLSRQTLYIGISAVFCLVVFFSVPMKKWKQLTPYILIFSMILLLLVLIIGTEKGETRRWISIAGLFSIQPAEVFKLAVILYLASFITRRVDILTSFQRVWYVAIFPIVGMGLIYLSGDLGSLVIIFCITMGILYLAGLRISWFMIMIALGISLIIVMIVTTPYRMARITTFLNPENDPYGANFQIRQSLSAVGRGDYFGVGLGNSLLRFQLSENHTDFILALITEEFGIVFILFLACVYVWIFIRAFSIGKKAEDLDLFFSSYVAKGVGIWIAIQSFFHIGVNLALLPTKGLTLPLISYGGSSLLITLIAITLLLRIDYENRRKILGYKI